MTPAFELVENALLIYDFLDRGTVYLSGGFRFNLPNCQMIWTMVFLGCSQKILLQSFPNPRIETGVFPCIEILIGPLSWYLAKSTNCFNLHEAAFPRGRSSKVDMIRAPNLQGFEGVYLEPQKHSLRKSRAGCGIEDKLLVSHCQSRYVDSPSCRNCSFRVSAEHRWMVTRRCRVQLLDGMVVGVRAYIFGGWNLCV